jgi:hypothetical protein
MDEEAKQKGFSAAERPRGLGQDSHVCRVRQAWHHRNRSCSCIAFRQRQTAGYVDAHGLLLGYGVYVPALHGRSGFRSMVTDTILAVTSERIHGPVGRAAGDSGGRLEGNPQR